MAGIDSTGVGTGPWLNTNPTIGIYFVGILVLGRYLIFSMYTAILVDAYEKTEIRRKVLETEGGTKELWRSGELSIMPTRKELPQVEDLFDEAKVELIAKNGKLKSLWTALHARRLCLSDISSAKQQRDSPASASEQITRLSSVEGFTRLSSLAGFVRVSSAASVALAANVKEAVVKKYDGLDFLGIVWQYTAQLGAWKQRKVYHKQTVVMLCQHEAHSHPAVFAPRSRTRSVDRTTSAITASFNRTASQEFGRMSSFHSVNTKNFEALESKEFQNDSKKDIVDEIEDFVLVPGAQLELVHKREFKALENIGLPNSVVFVIRIFMPFQHMKTGRDTLGAQFRKVMSKLDDGQAVSDNALSGIELYLCPETDKGTEKMFHYFVKLSKANADSIPLPAEIGLSPVEKKLREKGAQNKKIALHREYALSEHEISFQQTKCATSLHEHSSGSHGSSECDENEEDDGVLLQGVVRKAGQINTVYQERYFVLSTRGILRYYKNIDTFLNQEPWNGTLALTNATVEDDKGFDKNGYKFSVCDAFGRQLDCAVESQSQKMMWTESFKELSRKHQPSVKSREESTLPSEREEGVPEYVVSGCVYKRGNWMNPTFQKRWMTLSFDGVLAYYLSENDQRTGTRNCQGKLSCKGMKITEDTGQSIFSGKLFCFAVAASSRALDGRYMTLACDTNAERTEWVMSLKQMRDSLEGVQNIRISCSSV